MSDNILDEYLTNPNIRPITRKGYRLVLQRFHQFLKWKPWKKVTAKDIMRWLNTQENVTTKKTYLGTLKAFFRWLYDGDLPVAMRKITLKNQWRFRRRLQSDDLLTPEEVALLVEHCRNLRDKTLVMLLYGTGARIGEMLDVRIKDIVDFHGQTAIRVNGKTGEHYYYVSHQAMPWLSQYLQFLHDAPPNTRLFPLAYRGVHGLIERAAKRAGITKRVYPHLFRHMRNTRLVRKVGKDKAIRIMGYVSNTAVIDNYVHLTEQDTVNAFLESEGLPVPEPKEDPELRAPELLKCPRCHFENVEGSHFCARCTLPLGEQAEVGETLKDRIDQLEKTIYLMSEYIKLDKTKRAGASK